MAEWTAPGPGSWKLDTAHFETTVSRQMRDLIGMAMPSGTSEGFEFAGAPLKAIDGRFWLQEFARWEREWKPKLNATNRRLVRSVQLPTNWPVSGPNLHRSARFGT